MNINLTNNMNLGLGKGVASSKELSAKSNKEFSQVLENKPKGFDKSEPKTSKFGQVDKEIKRWDKPAPKEPDIKTEPARKNPKIEVAQEEKPKTRQDAMIEFLQDAQKQLGVSPEEVVVAFTTLNEQQLMSPPEESIAQVIENLNLPQEKRAMAKAMFEKMLSRGASSDMANYLQDSNQDLAVDVMTKAEAQQKTVKENLNELSDRFFLDGSYSRTSQMAQKAKAAQAYQQPGPTGNPPVVGQSSGLNAGQNLGPNLSSSAQLNQAQTGMELNGEWQATDAKSTPVPAMIDPRMASKSEVANAQTNIMAESMSATSKPVAVEPNVLDPKIADTTTDMAATQNLDMSDIVKANANIESGMQEGAEGETSEQLTQFGLNNVNKNAQKSELGQTQFVLNTSEASDGDQAANVREIVSQAQFMAKKGGGEMKIQLNPEGLGEVSLKVQTENGKVSVEMLTSSNEAKKVLERGLADLRSTLLSHKLSVDEIKLDLSNNTQNDSELDQNNEERSYQQRFLEEFRNGNRSWQRGMYDLGGAKSVKSQTQDDADNSYMTPSNSGAKGKASRRLDLVA